MLNNKKSIIAAALVMKFFLFSNAFAAAFPINQKISSENPIITFCTTAPIFENDHCSTQIAYSWTIYSGSRYGELSLAYWGGTDRYASSSGECGLRVGGKYLIGQKGYASDTTDLTACFFTDMVAVELLKMMLSERRFEFSEPIFEGVNRNHAFYTSDIGLGRGKENYIISSAIHHIKVSSKRTKKDNPYLGFFDLAVESPWRFGKILIKFIYYDVIK